MKFATMLSAAALVVAFGLTTAQAQAPGGMDQGGPPAASPGGAGGPAGGPDMAPGGPSGGGMQEDLGGPGLTGPRGDQPGLGAEAEGDMGAEGRAGAEAEGEGKAGAEAKGEAEAEGKAGTRAEGKGDREAEGKAGTRAEGKGDLDEGKAGTRAEGKGDLDEGKAGASAEGRRGDRDGKSAKLEREQVSKVRSHFSQHKPRVKSIEKSEVSVSIGVALPGTIALYDLPPDVIVVGGACPIKYFVWGPDVVLVDSCTREVVEVIAGVA